MRRRQDDGQGRQEHCPGNMPGKIGRIRIIFARFGSCPIFCPGNMPGEIRVPGPVGSASLLPASDQAFFYIKFFAKEDGRWKMLIF
jgi:hypothetical protein